MWRWESRRPTLLFSPLPGDMIEVGVRLIRPMSHRVGVADVTWTLAEPPFDTTETHATKAVEFKGYFLS